ncbi:MAG: acyl-CoA dehydrogenase family protein [Myxococcota bacterium]
MARQAAAGRVQRLLEHPIGHGHPDVGRLFTAVGEMRIGLVPAWLMVQRAASIPEVGTLPRTWALAEAKQVVAETGARIAQDALRVVGATALQARLSPFERLFRDLHAGLVMAIKPDNAAYLAGRFELGVLPDGLAELVAPPPRVLVVTPQFPVEGRRRWAGCTRTAPSSSPGCARRGAR